MRRLGCKDDNRTFCESFYGISLYFDLPSR